MLINEVESGLGTITRDSFEYVGATELAARLIFLHEHWLDFRNNFSLLSNQIAEIVEKSKRFPIVCLSWNYHPVDKIKLILDRDLGKENYFMIVTDPEHDSDINTALWPHFLIAIHPMRNFQKVQDKKYRISYLSGRLRYHRLKLWNTVKDLIQPDDVVVVNRLGLENYENTFDHVKVSLNQATDLLYNCLTDLPWSSQINYLDNSDQSVMHSRNQWENNHCAYNAMINITSETETNNRFMITEKTWKAYRSGCLVINFGPTDVPAYLSRLGFGIWQEYDQNVDTDSKIDLIKQVFALENIVDIYCKNFDMIQHNRDLVSSLDFIKRQAEPCLDKLSSLIS